MTANYHHDINREAVNTMTKTIIDPFTGIEYKSVDTQARSATEVHDLGDGMIEAIVSVTNVKDNVGDVILPGAYEQTLTERTPKGVWHHSWTDPIAKTHEVKELLPGDSLLPDTLPDGRPWPKNAGALYVKMEFNLNTDKGRNAYEDVKFFGDSQEWSIGYRVPEKKSYRKNGVRYIEQLDLYEYSPVLFGAMPSARTATVKDAQLAYKSLMGDTTSEPNQEGPIVDPQKIVELKSALSAFADQFTQLVETIAEFTEGKDNSAAHEDDDRQQVLDIAADLGIAEDDLHDFHDALDEGDLDTAGTKANGLMDVLEAKGDDNAALVIEHMAMELKAATSKKKRPWEDDEDDAEQDDEPADDEQDEPTDDEADDEDAEDAPEDDEPVDDEDEQDESKKPARKRNTSRKSDESDVEVKSIPIADIAAYL